MDNTKINESIVRFESAILANPPAWETKEEYMAYSTWMDERMNVSKSFKSALVEGDANKAKSIINQAKKQYGVKF